MTEHPREALYYRPVDDGIQCLLCPRECTLREGQAGLCHVRQNQGMRLIAGNYGLCSSAHIDPIEKKPLYHFHPGKHILSLGSIGCNLACQFCQNWQISQEHAPTEEILPVHAVAMARGARDNIGIAYTYNEPLIWYEFVLETSRLVRDAGMRNVLVTNGEINEAPLRELLPSVDALNVDIKGMDPEFYAQFCHGELASVLRTVRLAHEAGRHIELTNLIIPTLNDSEEQIGALVDWVAKLDPEIPLHFSRYYPAYRMNQPPTPLETLHKAYHIARERLRYVYLGNVLDDATAATYCPKCGSAVIERHGMGMSSMALDGARCRSCGEMIRIIVD